MKQKPEKLRCCYANDPRCPRRRCVHRKPHTVRDGCGFALCHAAQVTLSVSCLPTNHPVFQKESTHA